MKLRDRRSRRDPRLMVIPMIDIIFFLLVFFMLNTLYMVQQNVLPVQLPAAKTAEIQPAKQINVSVSKDGEIWLNDKKIELKDFRKMVKAELDKQPDTVFILRADRLVPHGQVVEVMDEMKAIGVKRVSIAVEGGN